MAKRHRLALHIFRRDLRIEDNTALLQAAQLAEAVIPLFIFDPRQIGNNPYKSDFLLQFMTQSLAELGQQIQASGSNLWFAYEPAPQALQQLLENNPIDLVSFNADYSPFARQRDAALLEICAKLQRQSIVSDDALLNPPGAVLKDNGDPYTIYTPFMKRARKNTVRPVNQSKINNFFQGPVAGAAREIPQEIIPALQPQAALQGGRQDALARIRRIADLAQYKELRDFPAIRGTTGLSAHNKFGTCSVREVYQAVAQSHGPEHTIINELYWRDFFTHIGFHFPHVIGGAFQRKYDQIEWENDPKKFAAWCQGRTGFPIVDAGMRELNQTGYMHNRVRMIVASFLIKDLHIDWRWGEKYFASKLVDYDVCVNNGNWQWAASTGCDAQPYFRIFNPWLQQERFDAEGQYIKRWVPELARLDAKDIHRLVSARSPFAPDYPSPMIDHRVEKEVAEEMYRECQ